MTLPKAIICEIDGVLANNKHRMHFIESPIYKRDDSTDPPTWEALEPFCPDYDSYYSSMDKDKVNIWCRSICYAAPFMNCSLVFITSIPKKFIKITESWLDECFARDLGGECKLFMRPDLMVPWKRLPHVPQMLPSMVDGSWMDCAGEVDELDPNNLVPDARPAHVVKRAIYFTEIAKKYDVMFVIEKDFQCAEMYRGLGLTVLQVK